jgi:hypothetical protein
MRSAARDRKIQSTCPSLQDDEVRLELSNAKGRHGREGNHSFIINAVGTAAVARLPRAPGPAATEILGNF